MPSDSGWTKWRDDPPTVDNAALFVACSSFPPYVWRLAERVYPNREIAASRDAQAIRAAARLHGFCQ